MQSYAYCTHVDNITVGRKTQKEHNGNLGYFLKVAKESNITFNERKCTYSSNSIDLLRYRISKGILKPDPGRVKPLLDMPVPENFKSLRRVIGMFAYYAQWITKYSDKIKSLVETKSFPISEQALQSYNELKKVSFDATLGIIDYEKQFAIETDPSEVAISTALN